MTDVTQMASGLDELLDMAIYKEIASQALYLAAQSKTRDPGARALMKELAEEEVKHSLWLKNLRDGEYELKRWHPEKVAELKISEYLTGSDTLTGAGLQDTLTFAMKREGLSVEFYSKMVGIMRGGSAKQLCQALAFEELKHKLRLETLYDEMFLTED